MKILKKLLAGTALLILANNALAQKISDSELKKKCKTA